MKKETRGNKMKNILLATCVLTASISIIANTSTFNSNGSSPGTFSNAGGGTSTYNSDGSGSSTMYNGNQASTYNSDGSTSGTNSNY